MATSYLGDVRIRRAERPLVLASLFDNRLADRESAFKGFNDNQFKTKNWRFWRTNLYYRTAIPKKNWNIEMPLQAH